MGGSTLGAHAIYDFLNHKIKKKFKFTDNLQTNLFKDKKKFTNLIISKSGNTIETIVNANILIKKKDKNKIQIDIFFIGCKNNFFSFLI